MAKVTTLAFKYGFNVTSKYHYNFGYSIKIKGSLENFQEFIETANYLLGRTSDGIKIVKYKLKKDRKKKIKDNKYL